MLDNFVLLNKKVRGENKFNGKSFKGLKLLKMCMKEILSILKCLNDIETD